MIEEAERSYGWSREELIGQSIITIVPPERHAQSWDLIRQCKEGKAVRNIEALRWNKRRQIIPVLLTLTLLKNSDNNATGVAVLAKDIRERKQAEEKLVEERSGTLKEKLIDLERFERFAVEREERMIDLKKEINTLLSERGQPSRYKIVPEDTDKGNHGHV